MADYKEDFDSRIEESLEYLYDTSIPMFSKEINGPIRYHNAQVGVWFGGLDEDKKNQLLLDEYEVS